MRHATYAEAKARVRKRPNDNADKLNPFNPSPDPAALPRRGHLSHSEPSLEDQRQVLLALRARLRGNVAQTADAALGGYALESTSASPDAVELASETIEQDLALNLLGSATGTLDEIEAALERIEDGAYGRCEDCNARIPAARLEAIPYATCCVRCAARREPDA